MAKGNARIRIQAERCQKCRLCVEICPEGLFVQEPPGSVPKITRPKDCVACGHCVSVCQAGAVVHQDFLEFSIIRRPSGNGNS